MELQTQFTQAVKKSVADIFNTMILLEEIPLEKNHLKEKPSLPPPKLVGIIDIEGSLNGCISIELPYPLAIEMASLLISEPLSEVNEDVYEAVAEFTNMVAGGIKSSMSKNSERFNIGLPQVLDLNNIPRHPMFHSFLNIQVPISTKKGFFIVQSHIKESF